MCAVTLDSLSVICNMLITAINLYCHKAYAVYTVNIYCRPIAGKKEANKSLLPPAYAVHCKYLYIAGKREAN